MSPSQSKQNESKYVVVTGANGGIGRAISKRLAQESYSLILCVREENESFSNWALSLSEKHKIEVHVVCFDFKFPERVKNASINLARNYDVFALINCAGMPFGATTLLTKIEDLRIVFEVNFINQVLFTQQILKAMCSRKKGSIVNVASMSALNADAGTLAYGASKAALVHFTKVAAAESGRFGVRVNAVCPGPIDTEMLMEMNDQALNKLKSKVALGRVGTPDEVASAVHFLISDESAYISGEVMRINGGDA
jgi:3-oxoacyl-[acyl-carrier protein] reductase